MIVHFEVPGIPVGKGRPRFGKGRTYTPVKTVAHEKAIATYARMSFKRPLEGPVKVTVASYHPRPKRLTKAQQSAITAGKLHPSKPDLDNVVKCVLDALNGIAYLDDSQVVMIEASKNYNSPTGSSVTIITVLETATAASPDKTRSPAT